MCDHLGPNLRHAETCSASYFAGAYSYIFEKLTRLLRLIDSGHLYRKFLAAIPPSQVLYRPSRLRNMPTQLPAIDPGCLPTHQPTISPRIAPSPALSHIALAEPWPRVSWKSKTTMNQLRSQDLKTHCAIAGVAIQGCDIRDFLIFWMGPAMIVNLIGPPVAYNTSSVNASFSSPFPSSSSCNNYEKNEDAGFTLAGKWSMTLLTSKRYSGTDGYVYENMEAVAGRAREAQEQRTKERVVDEEEEW
ncbi:hypothetical protein M406DRAFT_68127 [Cryphonectria parasitica EP155]|uniref:Uncharacterized protein n=1 Tax=Cryphonectria parasitica (strain ATCC 38755 / EP155) TaxID=660469 RepID=A0A9P5CPS0_CRYP1|nr:uncharacterized protein M406DRAFT_68127 [Cryphonectria parasitica EP155]KAF3765707.1 hypothetical protein M406DRAFT_68127 [Cryphonectria parasitica EP155]